ncbi:hypothetical protein DFH27DRAFT_258406 [Peziza echinospora]|nr:hypothetical protein DFH27DRAFT_258406 [Peziza echinospora]
MAVSYRNSRDPYMPSYSYYQPHPQQSYSLPMTPDYLGTPPSSSAVLASYNSYHLPPSPQYSTSSTADYWRQYPTYGQYPPTPTSPHSPYSHYSSPTSYSPSSHFPAPHVASSPRSGLPEIPDYLNSRDSRPRAPVLRAPQEPHRARKRRASPNAIADLQTLRLSDLPEEDRNCNICMEPYIDDRYPCDQPKRENAMKMPCGHVFGSYCLKQWLENHNTCPACRMEVEYVETEEVEQAPRSRTRRRPSLSTHELIVNDLFGEPYRDPAPAPAPAPRSKTPHPSSTQGRPFFGSYEDEYRTGSSNPAASRPALRRSQTSMGAGGPVLYPFARPPSDDYGRYGPPSPPRISGMREPIARPPSSSSSAAATTQSEPSRGSDGYYSQPGLPSARSSNSRANPFRRDPRCGFEAMGLCVMEGEDEHAHNKLVRLECGHGFHSQCLYTSMKARGDAADLSSRVLWCERCRKHIPRK